MIIAVLGNFLCGSWVMCDQDAKIVSVLDQDFMFLWVVFMLNSVHFVYIIKINFVLAQTRVIIELPQFYIQPELHVNISAFFHQLQALSAHFLIGFILIYKTSYIFNCQAKCFTVIHSCLYFKSFSKIRTQSKIKSFYFQN